MVEALGSCAEMLDGFGGHAQAAGIRIQRGRLEEFRKGVNEYARTRISPADFRPKLACDGEVMLDSISHAFISELERLEPYGQGAPEPVLVAHNVQLTGPPRRVGASGKHLSCYLSQGGTPLRAIAFGMGEMAERLPRPQQGAFHVAFTPVIETFTGKSGIELRIQDIHIPGEDET
jgi:single-stranded-DNA-specific exonuclease